MVVKKNIMERIYSVCNKLKEFYRIVVVSYFCKDIKFLYLVKKIGKNIKILEI